MNRWTRIALLLIMCVIPTVFAAAEEDTVSFVIAPPPVGYPNFVKGFMDIHTGGTAVYGNITALDKKVHLFGASAFGNMQYCFSDRLAVNGALGVMLLAGSRYDMLFSQLPLQANAAYEFMKTPNNSFYVLGGLGGDIGVMSMTVSVPQIVGMLLVIDDTTLSTLTASGRVTLGAQANLGIGKFILSPFGVFTYTAGTYSATQESTMSFSYPSYSGSIPGYSTTIFGFDLLYTPKNISLSSLVHNTDTTTLVSIAVKWLLSRYEPKR